MTFYKKHPFLVSALIYLILLMGIRFVAPCGAVFYQSLAVQGVIIVVNIFMRFSKKDMTLIFLGLYAFAMTIPVVVDRAYSVYLLIHVPENGMKREEMLIMYDHFFAQEGIEKRLIEQSTLHTLHQKEDKFFLTPWGKFIQKSLTTGRQIFSCDSCQHKTR